MLSERQVEYLQDMVDAAHSAQSYVAGYNRTQFEAEPKTQHAVLYSLLVLSEAAKRLKPVASEHLPALPWDDIRALGNHLRHGYDRLEMDTIWQILDDDLPPLIAKCEAVIIAQK